MGDHCVGFLVELHPLDDRSVAHPRDHYIWCRTYALLARFRAAGRALLISRRQRPNGQRRVDRVRAHMRVKHAMNEKLATDRGRTLYERRKAMIEPVFAQHKAVRGFGRFV